MVARRLFQSEKDLARTVFGSTLPLQNVYITGFKGIGDRAFVAAIPKNFEVSLTDLYALQYGGMGALYAALNSEKTGWTTTAYYLCLGSKHYRRGMTHSKNTRSLFIHELTHVWQGVNGTFSQEYIVRSLAEQGGCEVGSWLTGEEKSAYSVSVGKKKWDDYGIEQQASLVESWYHRGQQQTNEDGAYHFIRDHIRKGVKTDVQEIKKAAFGKWG